MGTILTYDISKKKLNDKIIIRRNKTLRDQIIREIRPVGDDGKDLWNMQVLNHHRNIH